MHFKKKIPISAFASCHKPFSPPISSSLLAHPCRSHRLHNWCKYCHMCQGVEALLVYFCATLYRRTLSGESSLMPVVENQLVSGLIHTAVRAVAARLFHQGDWEQKVQEQIPAYAQHPAHTLFIFVAHPLCSSHLNILLPNSQISFHSFSYLFCGVSSKPLGL